MRVRGTVAAAVLLAVLPAPATADPPTPTCRGQAATIVGTPGGSVTGTDGPDVIVSNGAASVSAGAGADLVCLTSAPGGPVQVSVDAGSGADLVDATAAGAATFATLGFGRDTFLGGAERDVVRDATGPFPPDYPPVGANFDADTIDTGGGPDFVGIGPFSARDQVRLGAGDDELFYLGNPRARANVSGGAGHDRVRSEQERVGEVNEGHYVIDERRGQLLRNGVRLGDLSGFEDFDLSGIDVKTLTFIGGPEAERLQVADSLEVSGPQNGDVSRGLSIDMGGGDDQVVLGLVNRLDCQVDGGPGRDLLRLGFLQQDHLVVDLQRHRWSGFCQSAAAPPSTVTGVENVSAEGGTVRLYGDAGPNRLVAHDADAVLRGRRGDDVLVADDPSALSVAYGGPGRDICLARVLHHCESH